MPTVELANGKLLPLLGVGVGNLQQHKVINVISEAAGNYGVRLVDTAAASGNEHLVSEALALVESGPSVSVITKVWYTHLGFERTLLSVQKSLSHFVGRQSLDVVLLHWPRCRHDISWMRCDDEERALPADVKAAGPAPTHNSWRESWRALENLYRDGSVGSIGVSNFDLNEMRDLFAFSDIKPHVYQGNVWSIIFDPHLMDFLRMHKVHFQAFNVFGGVLQNIRRSTSLRRRLENVGASVKASPVQVVLGWLLQQNISIIPRSSSVAHLEENVGASLIKRLNDGQMAEVNRCVSELLRVGDGHNPDNDEVAGSVTARFQNKANQPVRLFWLNPNEAEEKLVNVIDPGVTVGMNTFSGHEFVARFEDETVANNEEYRFKIRSNSETEQVFLVSRHLEL
eukprot:TRINITY_DN19782_c0_g1_i1.p1 TRINITY_DN19782_c0_g1~~TRINITY_DN19782_c0_g1_i1.p1  ORF type:complete len:452 (-),score=78.58 TRINITY_DN19782_c0_g1_i1:82-1275(-)